MQLSELESQAKSDTHPEDWVEPVTPDAQPPERSDNYTADDEEHDKATVTLPEIPSSDRTQVERDNASAAASRFNRELEDAAAHQTELAQAGELPEQEPPPQPGPPPAKPGLPKSPETVRGVYDLIDDLDTAFDALLSLRNDIDEALSLTREKDAAWDDVDPNDPVADMLATLGFGPKREMVSLSIRSCPKCGDEAEVRQVMGQLSGLCASCGHTGPGEEFPKTGQREVDPRPKQAGCERVPDLEIQVADKLSREWLGREGIHTIYVDPNDGVPCV